MIHVLAQAAGAADGWVQYGAIGIAAVVAFGFARVMFIRLNAMHDAERQRADRLEEQLRQTNAAIQDKQLQILGEVAIVMRQVLEEMREERRP